MSQTIEKSAYTSADNINDSLSDSQDLKGSYHRSSDTNSDQRNSVLPVVSAFKNVVSLNAKIACL